MEERWGWSWGGVGSQRSEVKEGEGLRFGGVRKRGVEQEGE